jgi:hypothetical protein
MVPLPMSSEVYRLAALHCKGGYTAHLIAIREAAVILTPLHLAGVCMRHDQRHRAGGTRGQRLQLTSSGRRRLREDDGAGCEPSAAPYRPRCRQRHNDRGGLTTGAARRRIRPLRWPARSAKFGRAMCRDAWGRRPCCVRVVERSFFFRSLRTLLP